MYSQPLTNVQLEILKTFSYNLDLTDLQKLRDTLAAFFAERAVINANKAWEKKEWTEETMDDLLNSKLRKSK